MFLFIKFKVNTACECDILWDISCNLHDPVLWVNTVTQLSNQVNTFKLFHWVNSVQSLMSQLSKIFNESTQYNP